MKPAIKKGVLIFSGLTAGLLTVEATLRIVGFSHPPFLLIDRDRGWALIRGQQAWSEDEAGRVYIRINNDGLHDREHTRLKPPDTLRIAVLGDSYAEAMQVATEDAFWAVMERELGGCQSLAGRKVEVINFGVSGYGTAQEILTLRRHVWRYSPDLILLVFTTSNDISDNSRALVQEPQRPYFVYRGTNLVLDSSFRESVGYRVRQLWPFRMYYEALRYSRALQLLNRTKGLIREHRLRARLQGNASKPGEEIGLVDQVYREPADDAWKDAWRVSEDLLVSMRDEVRERRAGFLVATATRGIQVHPNPAAREKFMEQGIKNFLYPDLRISALGAREGFDVLTLAPAFQAYAEQHHVFLHGFGNSLGQGHWNRDGHRLAGKMIAERVCRDLSSSQKRSVIGARSAPPRSGNSVQQ